MVCDLVSSHNCCLKQSDLPFHSTIPIYSSTKCRAAINRIIPKDVGYHKRLVKVPYIEGDFCNRFDGIVWTEAFYLYKASIIKKNILWICFSLFSENSETAFFIVSNSIKIVNSSLVLNIKQAGTQKSRASDFCGNNPFCFIFIKARTC